MRRKEKPHSSGQLESGTQDGAAGPGRTAPCDTLIIADSERGVKEDSIHDAIP